MSNIAVKLKQDQLLARKARDAVKTSLLTTLMSDISMIAKNDGNRDVTDMDVVKTVKKYIKNTEDLITQIGDKNQEAVNVAKQELSILETYLPTQLSESELRNIISVFVSQIENPSMKSLGGIMKNLTAAHEGQYDGSLASKIARDILSKL